MSAPTQTNIHTHTVVVNKTQESQSTIDILTSGTENRGKGNSAKGKEEQKPVTTVALDRVCVRV